MLTQSFAEAVVEAEKIITGGPHIQTEQDLTEGYDYLAGSIRAAVQMAWAYQRDFPYFVQSTGPYTKLGLDNPDTLYFHSYLRPCRRCHAPPARSARQPRRARAPLCIVGLRPHR